jgi:WD40 repeat protein
LDGTVKLWLIKTAATNIIAQSPSLELADHEYPVECVAINNEGEYGAGGGEDGTVIVWDLNQQNVLFSHPCTSGKK